MKLFYFIKVRIYWEPQVYICLYLVDSFVCKLFAICALNPTSFPGTLGTRSVLVYELNFITLLEEMNGSSCRPVIN